MDTLSNRITNFYMTGSLKTYMSLILSTVLIVSVVYMFLTDGFAFSTDQLAEPSFIEIAVVAVMIIAAIATIYMNHNVAAILVLGVVGFGVAILFVIYRAPDIALTQLVIETVTVALFLLCFYHLPKMRKSTDSIKTKTINAIISIAFGALITIVAISAKQQQMV